MTDREQQERMKLHERKVVSANMEKYGGSFVQHLGRAVRKADPINLDKIQNTWPDLWSKYLEMGE